MVKVEYDGGINMKMSFKKSISAVVLALTIMLGGAVSVYAASFGNSFNGASSVI